MTETSDKIMLTAYTSKSIHILSDYGRSEAKEN